MTQQRVVLVTGGMGGLGQTISTKMVDAGYRLAVTYSPGNKTHAEWLQQMEAVLIGARLERPELVQQLMRQLRAGGEERANALLSLPANVHIPPVPKKA